MLNYANNNSYYFNEVGKGKNESIGAGLYANFSRDNGMYLGLIARAASITGSYDLIDSLDIRMDGDFITWSANFQAELGKIKDLGNNYSVKPNVAVNIGRIAGFDTVAGNNLTASYDDMNILSTRIGAVFAQEFRAANIYLSGNYYHDFSASPTINAGILNIDGTVEQKVKQINSYFGLGFGAAFDISDNGVLDLGISRLFGTGISGNFKLNAGMRFIF